MQSSYNLHNKIFFKIRGQGKLYDYLKFQHKFFEVEKNKKDDFILTVEDSINSFRKGFRKKVKKPMYFGNKEQFVVRKKKGVAVFDGSKSLFRQKRIVVNNDMSNMSTNFFLDLLMRIRMLEQNVFLIHAGCVSLENKAIIAVAQKGVGKTTLCLKLIEAGYDFLGDDKIWIDSGGNVFSYPRYVVLKNTNALLFPKFLDNYYILKLRLKNRLSDLIGDKYFSRILNYILKTPARYFYVEDLYPKVNTLTKSCVNRVLYVARENVGDIVFSPLSSEGLKNYVKEINNEEWNKKALEIAIAHDNIFPKSPSWVKEVEELFNKEEKIMESCFDFRNIYSYKIPLKNEEIDWGLLVKEIIKNE
jgi:GTPase SAR1 family protein